MNTLDQIHCPIIAAVGPVLVGIDSLYLSSFLDGLGIDWEVLRYEREKLRATVGAEHVEFDLGGERFALKRGGRKPYSFVLTNRNFELHLGENIQPRCHAKFSSELLWRDGLEGAVRRYDTIWQRAGERATRPEVVFRVDAAFDFAIGVPDFQTEHFVSQAAKDATWREGGALQSVQLGTSDVVVRVYDKVAEIEQQSGKHWLFDLWGTNEGVWRCEFQIRGERLREAGIATVQQLRAYLPSLVRHLARQHTTLRMPTGDTNRSRWPLHPMWRGLIAATDHLTCPPEYPPPPLLAGGTYQLERQLNSLEGNLKGIAAVLSRNSPDSPVTLDQLLRWLPRMMRRRHSPEIWKADVIAKIRKRELGL